MTALVDELDTCFGWATQNCGTTLACRAERDEFTFVD
jgi:hypothetical protein